MCYQPGPARARHGQWPRWQQTQLGYTFPYKMADFHGVYLKFGRIDSADFFFFWYIEKCLSYCHKISKWCDEPVFCYRRVKICNFAMSKQGPSMREHHLRQCPDTFARDWLVQDSAVFCAWMSVEQSRLYRIDSTLIGHFFYHSSYTPTQIRHRDCCRCPSVK